MPVESLHGIVVPAKIGPGQSEPGKQAFGARVGQDFGIQLPVGIGGSMATHRSGCRRSVRSKLEVAGDHPLHSFVALKNHNQIHAFDADLQSPVSASDRKERRRAPSVFGSAGGYASAVLRAKHQAALDHVRHDGNALCVLQHLLRNAIIRRGHDLVQHQGCIVEPVLHIFASFRPGGACHTQTDQCH